MIEAQRASHGQACTERRYYLGYRRADAITLGSVVRGHWSIEIQLHGSLDVTFSEDQAWMPAGHAEENFSILRRVV